MTARLPVLIGTGLVAGAVVLAASVVAEQRDGSLPDAEALTVGRALYEAHCAAYESEMPAFGGVLSDAEIWTVLEYIKSTWQERERRYQENVSQTN